MSASARIPLRIDAATTVSALILDPPGARACYVLAHGAGAGMEHRSVASVATGLAERGVATFRYQFPFMEAGTRRPDPPGLARATVRSAVAEAARLLPGSALVAGGRSFGGRMTSQAQAETPLPGVRGLAFLAFPLHPAGRVGADRARHLREVDVPMLFLQGTRDALADLPTLEGVVAELGPRATLHLAPEADHSFHVPARSGRTDAEVARDLLDVLASWIARVTGDPA